MITKQHERPSSTHRIRPPTLGVSSHQSTNICTHHHRLATPHRLHLQRDAARTIASDWPGGAPRHSAESPCGRAGPSAACDARRPSPSGALAVTSRRPESSLGSRGPPLSLNLSGSPESGDPAQPAPLRVSKTTRAGIPIVTSSQCARHSAGYG
ncbi:unnamed protein product [Lampetra planeri]